MCLPGVCCSLTKSLMGIPSGISVIETWTLFSLSILGHVSSQMTSPHLQSSHQNSTQGTPNSQHPTIDQVISRAGDPRALSYSVPAGHALTRGRLNPILVLDYDVLIPLDQYKKAINTDTTTNATAKGAPVRRKRKATKARKQLWDDKEVLMAIDKDSNFSAAEIQNIQEAVQEWRDKTCVKFRTPSTFDIHVKKRPFVFIQNGSGCSSAIGKNPILKMKTVKYQPLNLGPGCLEKHVIMHEIGHVLGMIHEHSRFDRDEYLNIIWKNVKTSMKHNFQQFSKAVMSALEVPYDYRSLMHYGPSAFSVNGSPTMRPKNKKYGDVIGKATKISFNDALLVNILYKCKEPAQ